MPRLVIVLPVRPLSVGESFAVSSWPLHVTVLPPFLTDAPAGDIAEAMATVAPCSHLSPSSPAMTRCSGAGTTSP